MRLSRLALFAIGVVLVGSPSAFAAAGCPQFLVASGYADLCSPSAWMAFEHEARDGDRAIKRRLHHSGANKPAKIKYRPARGSKSARK
jgi:hypothetical protein